MVSPTRSVPRWTRTVATAPRPRSRWDSIAMPCASCSGLARRSSEASAVRTTASSRASMLQTLLGGDVDEHGVAAVLLGHQTELGELTAHLGRVGTLDVDLVDRDHDRHVGRLGVVQRLDRLRHHTVVGRDHEDRDVGRLRTTGTHGGERLVTRGVDEGDLALFAVDLGGDLVRTDVLRDAAGLARDDVRLADGVEQAGLTVVDVTHDGHDRRTRRRGRPRRPRPRRTRCRRTRAARGPPPPG